MLFENIHQIVGKPIWVLLCVGQVTLKIPIAAITRHKLLQLPQNRDFAVVLVDNDRLVLRFHAMHDPRRQTGFARTAHTRQQHPLDGFFCKGSKNLFGLPAPANKGFLAGDGHDVLFTVKQLMAALAGSFGAGGLAAVNQRPAPIGGNIHPPQMPVGVFASVLMFLQ